MARTRILDENEIVESVCRYLEDLGYHISGKCHTKQKGVDITAEHLDRGILRIEAKGGTSSRPGSSRYGKEFTASQVFDRVAKGFCTAACMSQGDGESVAVAFPDTELFRKYLEKLRPSATKLGIAVYLVRSDGEVDLF